MRSRLLALALIVAGAACTGSPAAPTPAPPPTPGAAGSSPIPGPSGPAPIGLDVVAAVGPAESTEVGNDQGYLDGMGLAVASVNAAGGIGGRPLELRLHDDEGDPGRATAVIGGLLDRGPTAILVVGSGDALAPLRLRFAQAGTPAVLLQGDLYSSRRLFPQAFQTTIPWEWQARVMAKYAVTDRRAGDVVFVGAGPEAGQGVATIRDQLEYWGGGLHGSYVTPPPAGLPSPHGPASAADLAVVLGSPSDHAAIAGALTTGAHRPRIVAAAGSLVHTAGADPLPPGTTACYTYTWAGWAHPIPRVARFVASFQAMFGHPPLGLEQEGYDAVRALALGLERDGGRGGPALTAALETITETSFSGFPIDLGPDDHVFPPRDELGLFAVPGPHERLDPWQHRDDPNLWRPLMRTFTYDGERDNLIDQDRPVFFPGWEKNQPGPPYWESRYGIVSRPRDPLH